MKSCKCPLIGTERECVINGLLCSTPKKTEYFPITSVTRDDIKHASFPDVEFTDAEMKRIAGKMADDYINQLFWGSLEIIAGHVLDEREERIP